MKFIVNGNLLICIRESGSSIYAFANSIANRIYMPRNLWAENHVFRLARKPDNVRVLVDFGFAGVLRLSGLEDGWLRLGAHGPS